MAWLWLAVAIALEVSGTLSLRATEGFTRLLPSVLVVLAYALSFVALSRSLVAGMEVGVAYAVWSGVGTAVVAAVGILAWGESAGTVKLASLALIVIGVIGLNVAGGAH